ncbi:MAG: AAA family ATPase [Candidatus Micrarchaeaceae archaeon]
MLRSIELRNWKTHRDTKLEFSRGTNILIGSMGAGKSSVLDAIAYALFGKYPALQHRRISITNIITNRPEQMREASVRLAFDAEGNSYEVTRSISLDGTTKATLSKNGAYVQSQPQRVTEEIEKVLKVDYDLFARAVYSEQNGLTYFLELSPKDRKKELDELLGLNLFANAFENTTALANKIKDMAESEGMAAKGFDLERHKQQLDTLKQSLERLAKEKEHNEEELSKAKAGFESTGKELEEAKALLAKKNALSKELAEQASKAAMLQKEIEKIKEQVKESKEELGKNIERQKAIVERLDKEHDAEVRMEKALISELAAAKAELRQLEKESKEQESISAELAQKGSSKSVAELAEKKKKELDGLMSKKASLNAAKSDNEKWLVELESHVAKCPVCERELTEDMIKMLLKSKSEAIESARAEIEKLSKQEQALQKEVKELEKRANELAVLESRAMELAHANEKRKSAAEQAKELETRAKAASEGAEAKGRELAAAKEALAKLEQSAAELSRKERYETELSAVTKESSAKQRELDHIKIDETQAEAVQKRHMEASSALSAAKASLESYEKLISETEKQIKDKKEQIEQINRLYANIEKKKKVVNELLKYKNAIAATQAELRASLVDYINRTMQAVWPELYPYSDYTSIKLEPAEDDYVLMLRTNRQGSEWEAVEAIASGGERSTACLALRVAFALVLVPNLKWLILDEPTHNIDRQGIEKFVKAVSEALPKYIEQIFIITHDELLKQARDAKIYMLARDKSASTGTAAERL